MPSELEIAELVTLYKKGNVENPANYRPIALLNTLYKIYASLIHRRISLGLDNRLWGIQYGFKKCRSTSQPLFITRRMQDQAEQSNEKLFLVFLDWEKALDKVDQEKLLEAMQRLGLPQKMMKVLASFYAHNKRQTGNPGGSLEARWPTAIRLGKRKLHMDLRVEY